MPSTGPVILPVILVGDESSAGDPYRELEHLLTTMAKCLVDNPDEIVVMPATGDGFVHFEVRTDNSDTGTLIGKRGMHAEAIRTVMMAAGAVRRIRVSIQILSRDGDDRSR